VPFKELDSDFLAKRTYEFASFIKQTFGLDAFPCYGTLLGMYRDNDFLPHDDDIDLAVVVDLEEGKTANESTREWIDRIEAYGMKCRLPSQNSSNFHVYFSDCDMDLFIMHRVKKKKIHTHMEHYVLKDIDRSLIEPLTTFEFKGYEFNAPHKIEAFLERRYGKGWTVPDPTFEI